MDAEEVMDTHLLHIVEMSLWCMGFAGKVLRIDGIDEWSNGWPLVVVVLFGGAYSMNFGWINI